MPPPPHPALEAALEALKSLHADPATRRVLAEPPSLPDFTLLGGLLQALGLWRLAKGAYLFHPHLAREVARTPLGKLPVELLLRLPEPAPLLLLPEGLPSWPELRGAHVLVNQSAH